MFTIETELDIQVWKLDDKDFEKFLNYQKQHRIDDNRIENLASKCILDELDGKVYNSPLGMQISQNISKTLCQELAEKSPFYKIIIQTFVGKLSDEKKNFQVYVSYRFDQRTDKCFIITKHNGQM
ncbi:unnamed protein product [Adineta ricciae]|uniref:Uncharacterized protein n=1 Tax=Adineta ricciae TaxID=249248 RepID=A0A816GLD9_ADIRI|nr:unnamed protein product [Adineta ricciae]CAF1676127.1 unnamed protein product [Adineta ricciae]